MTSAGLAFFFGLIAALGQAPFNMPVLTLVGICGAVWLFQLAARARRAALVGWAFGAGYFGLSLHWIVSPFLVDAARHGWMAPFALVFLAAGLALFWGGAFWAARKLSLGSWPLVLTWPAAEMLRAYIFTGFPWAMPAQAMVDVPLGQLLAFIGPYGLNFLIMAIAISVQPPYGRLLAKQAFALLVAATMFLPLPEHAIPHTAKTVRLIQPNVPQHEKWDPEKIGVFFERQLAFTAQAPAESEDRPALVIWPETALPWALDLAGTALKEIAVSGAGSTVVLGAQRRGDTRYYNAMVVLDAAGNVAQSYDKHHLVPFGEYMPLGDFLANFGIYGLAARAGNGYSAGPGAALLDFGTLGRALPLICYEAVFPHDVNAAPERPDFLIQITNDAWFGPAAGPLQHLAQARMRAIEQGLPLARSANTGVSAMIDPWGRITAALPLGQAGFVDAKLPQPRAETIYRKTGDLPLALLLGLLTMGAVLRARRTTD